MSTTSEIVMPTRRTPSENIATIKESMGEIAQVERDRLRQAYEHGKEKAHAVQMRFEDYVREKPVRALLIAAGTGALLGFFLSRRR